MILDKEQHYEFREGLVDIFYTISEKTEKLPDHNFGAGQKYVTINLIQVDEDIRGKGLGTAALASFALKMKKEGIVNFHLFAAYDDEQYEGDFNDIEKLNTLNRIVKFYTRFGFKPTISNATNHTDQIDMYLSIA